MDIEKQQIAIALHFGARWAHIGSGWTWITFKEVAGFEFIDSPTDASKIHISDSIPDYLSDLNAAHEAIKSLPANKRAVFAETLNRYVGAFDDDYYQGWYSPGGSFADGMFILATASCEQLAESFLRTLNLWEAK